jgi:predicted DNA-binding ribbon-helix-helix protein
MKRFQSPCLHHVRINGRDTSITVEPEFWEQFRLMTMERQTTIGKLLAEIDRTGRLLPHQGPGRHRVRTLSAAVRIFVFQALMARLADAEARVVRHDDAHGGAWPASVDHT